MQATIFAIVGAVSGIVSLLGIAYMIGLWRGRVETRVESLESQIREHPLAEIAMMVHTLWDIYVLDALRDRPDLVEHSSRYRLKKEAEHLVPQEIRDMLDQLDCCGLTPAWAVVKAVGMQKISHMANHNGFTVQQTIGILTAYATPRLNKG